MQRKFIAHTYSIAFCQVWVKIFLILPFNLSGCCLIYHGNQFHVHSHTHVSSHLTYTHSTLPLAMLMTYNSHFHNRSCHAFHSSFFSFSILSTAVKIGVEIIWGSLQKREREFKNENVGREERFFLFRKKHAGWGDLLILSGIFCESAKVFLLTQIRNGACWFLVTYDFECFCWCWWWTHLIMTNHGLTWWHSIAILK